MLAAMKDAAAVAKVLIDAGANVFVRNELGQTILHMAAGSCNASTASLLLTAGCDAMEKDFQGRAIDFYVGNGVSPQLAGRKKAAEIAGFFRLLARAPAFRACSWTWPAVAACSVPLASSSEAAHSQKFPVFCRKNGKRWTPIAAMCR